MNIDHENQTVMKTPVGPVRIRAREGAVVGIDLSDREASASAPDDGVLREATRQLAEYFDGTRCEFELPLRLEGTAFQRKVWDALLKIPYGTTTSYGALAESIGQPSASRAVGLANAKNPIAIVVPCHRVIGKDGSLTGYAFGEEKKRRLLALEQGDRSA